MTVGIPLPSRHGWGILLPVIPLCLAGIYTIEVSSDSMGFLAVETLKQMIFFGLGLIGMLTTLAIGHHRIGRLSYVFFVICVLLLFVLVLDRYVNIPFVTPIRNTRRWIRVAGFQIQPSELMKVSYVLGMAWYLRYRRNYRRLIGLIPPFALTLLPMGLIKLQPDLGTVLLFLPVLFAMLIAAGAKIRHLLIIIMLGLICSPLFWLKIHTYQRLRITGVLLQSEKLRDYLGQPADPEHGSATRWDLLKPEDMKKGEWRRELENWESETGYHLWRSKAAIGSGGPTGQGSGKGIFVEYNFLPEKHNDFIFAIIAHQWGLIGAIVVILCYGTIVIFGFEIATLSRDPFGRLLAVGLTIMLSVQALTNLCMTVGLAPITGVTLPFVSAGGSSLIVNLISVGLLISVAHHRPVLMGHRPFGSSELQSLQEKMV
jgi:rod shape determining protein RodA